MGALQRKQSRRVESVGAKAAPEAAHHARRRGARGGGGGEDRARPEARAVQNEALRERAEQVQGVGSDEQSCM